MHAADFCQSLVDHQATEGKAEADPGCSLLYDVGLEYLPSILYERKVSRLAGPDSVAAH